MDNLLNIDYKEDYNEFHTDYHYHNTYEIIFITHGSANFIIRNEEYHAKEGSIVLLSNLETHNIYSGDLPYKRYVLEIKEEFFDVHLQKPSLTALLKNRPESFENVIEVNNYSYILSIFGDIHNEYIEKNELFMYQIEANITKLLIILLRENYSHNLLFSKMKAGSNIDSIQKYIEENCTGDITLTEVAKKFYINRYYLSHIFKEYTGYTFKDYLILHRLSYAKRQLVSTDKSITEICLSSGFNNVNHFIRTFKQKEGITPFQYGKRFRIFN